MMGGGRGAKVLTSFKCFSMSNPSQPSWEGFRKKIGRWAMDRPDWIQSTVELAFVKFMEWKWKDALNITAAEIAG
jgi:hypothetical protein